MPRIRIVIISPYRLYRDALAVFMRDQGEFEVVATHAGVSEHSGSADGDALDAILLDARLIRNRYVVSGLRSCFPGAWVVAVGVSGNDREAVRCTRAGVDGIMGHDAPAAEIASVLDQIRRGAFPGSSRVATALFNHLASDRSDSSPAHIRLTPRQRQIVRLVALGLSNKRIGQELKLELATVKNHVHNILRKTGMSRRSLLIARFRAGFDG